MILSDTEVSERLNSPNNLINRINQLNRGNKQTGMELFGLNRKIDEIESPAAINSYMNDLNETTAEDSLDEVLPDNAAKIKLGLVKAKALDVLHASLNNLELKLPQVDRAKDLSSIARDMKTILSDDETTAKSSTNIVVYKPVTNEITKYDTIVVSE